MSKATGDATQKRADQQEQAQPQGTKAGAHDEESTYKYDELLAGAAEVQQLLDLIVLWVPVAVYAMFGDNRGVMYIFYGYGLSFLLGLVSSPLFGSIVPITRTLIDAHAQGT